MNERWAEKKAKRQALAAARTGWNTYSIHGRRLIHAMLKTYHSRSHDAVLGGALQMLLNECVARNERRYRHVFGLNNKYAPHQGKREIARRAA